MAAILSRSQCAKNWPVKMWEKIWVLEISWNAKRVHAFGSHCRTNQISNFSCKVRGAWSCPTVYLHIDQNYIRPHGIFCNVMKASIYIWLCCKMIRSKRPQVIMGLKLRSASGFRHRKWRYVLDVCTESNIIGMQQIYDCTEQKSETP